METRFLGASGFKVPAIGFGAGGWLIAGGVAGRGG